MSTMEVVIGTFVDDLEKADVFLKKYEKSHDQLNIAEAVMIVQEAGEKPIVTYMGVSKKKAAGIGTIAGAFIGVIGGPAGIVVGGAIGAFAGGAAAALSHVGVSKDMIEHVEQNMPETGSTIIVIVSLETHQLIIKDLKDGGAEIITETVSSDQVKKAGLISPSGGIGEMTS